MCICKFFLVEQCTLGRALMPEVFWKSELLVKELSGQSRMPTAAEADRLVVSCRLCRL